MFWLCLSLERTNMNSLGYTPPNIFWSIYMLLAYTMFSHQFIQIYPIPFNHDIIFHCGCNRLFNYCPTEGLLISHLVCFQCLNITVPWSTFVCVLIPEVELMGQRARISKTLIDKANLSSKDVCINIPAKNLKVFFLISQPHKHASLFTTLKSEQ